MARRILFLGPPGAGKGTQATMLANALRVPHISTGDMLRSAVTEGTGLGRTAESVMAAGDLVSDELVVAIVDERLGQGDCRCGYLLDGFPRNITQAIALEEAVADAIDTVLLLDVATDELVARLLKRAAEQGRTDDNEQTVRRRLEVYEAETTPLVDHYGAAVIAVPGTGSIDDVFARIVLSLATS